LLTVTVLAGWGLPMVLVSLFVLVSAVGFALPHASAIAMDRHRGIAGSASALLGLTQFALGAVTAPLVGIGDGTKGVALAITALGASVVGVAALVMARPEIGVADDAPHRLAGRD
jgi:DHA1 family bicyclomycin/chloramphenicol resistance-like MFS transporter